MTRSIAGGMLSALAVSVALSSGFDDMPAPPTPGEGAKRAKERLKAMTSNYSPGEEPIPETRQQRRARERRDFKRLPRI